MYAYLIRELIQMHIFIHLHTYQVLQVVLQSASKFEPSLQSVCNCNVTGRI